MGMGKHIHRLDLNQSITVSHHPDIPGQGCRIAGNIDDAFDTQLKHLLNNVWNKACQNVGENIDLYSGLKHYK